MSHGDEDRASALILALLARRAAGATICPSEVARALVMDSDADRWREAMPVVHAAIDRLVRAGTVRLSWKGRPLQARSGPYRIASADPRPD